jgi:hypothetical protein
MNDLFIIDVAETAISLAERHPESARVSVHDVWMELRRRNPIQYFDVPYGTVATRLSRAFPIHKNNRRGQKLFTIRREVAYEQFNDMGYRVRPFMHIDW